MGNTGAALVDSKAASFYNPSLLHYRKKSSYSLSGTTLATTQSRSQEGKFSGALFAPSYLSSVVAGDSLNHEFFFINFLSLQARFNFSALGTQTLTNGELNVNQNFGGYSMAFRSIPLALQFLIQFAEVSSFAFSETNDTASGIASTASTTASSRKAGFSIGLSTHASWDTYRLGFNFRTRSLQLYSHRQGRSRVFIRTPTDYTIQELKAQATTSQYAGHTLIIGQGFHVGSHDFLMDTKLQENAEQLDEYILTQSFGYRLKITDDHQFFCGLNHRLSEKVGQVGREMFISTGYSWKTRALQSAMGLFYSSNGVEQKTQSYGVNFASEFSY